MTMLGIALIIIGVIMIIKDGDSGKKDKWLNFIKESLTWASLFYAKNTVSFMKKGGMIYDIIYNFSNNFIDVNTICGDCHRFRWGCIYNSIWWFNCMYSYNSMHYQTSH